MEDSISLELEMVHALTSVLAFTPKDSLHKALNADLIFMTVQQIRIQAVTEGVALAEIVKRLGQSQGMAFADSLIAARRAARSHRP
jgi:hypothetical protein